MSEESMKLKVGEPIECKPPREGCMPVINGPSFDLIAFFSDLTKQEINDWLKGKVTYGVFIEESIPVFLLDLGKSWQLDVYLNIHQENEDVRKQFFEGDPNQTRMILTLVSYSEAIVKAIRTIGIDPVNMLRIKEACFDQLSKYSSKETCLEAAENILNNSGGKQLRKKTKMMK